MFEKPAYLIASSFFSREGGILGAYADAAIPLLERAGAELVVGGHQNQVLHHFEGAWNEGAAVTMFRFPSMDALLSFWNSEEYQAIKHLRTEATPSNFTIAVEEFDA